MNKTKELVTNIILVLLSILFVVLLFMFINEMRNMDYSYIRKADSFIYEIQDGRYSSMVNEVSSNRVSGAKETTEMKEIYGVADYFEAASLYKAYTEYGDQSKADEWKIKMEDAKTRLGDFSYVEEDINGKLGIE